jgi:hypothetical protein
MEEVRVVERATPAAVVSPKVKAGTIAGTSIAVVLSAVSMVLTLVTPAMFADLGPYAILVSTFLTALGAGIAAYLKTDPDRISQQTIHEYAQAQVLAAIAEYEQAEGRRVAKAAEEAKAAETKPADAPAEPVVVTGSPIYINDTPAVG